MSSPVARPKIPVVEPAGLPPKSDAATPVPTTHPNARPPRKQAAPQQRELGDLMRYAESVRYGSDELDENTWRPPEPEPPQTNRIRFTEVMELGRLHAWRAALTNRCSWSLRRMAIGYRSRAWLLHARLEELLLPLKHRVRRAACRSHPSIGNKCCLLLLLCL